VVKSLITLAHGDNLNTEVIYRRILTLENVSTAVNYHGIFITLASGLSVQGFTHFGFTPKNRLALALQGF
jgi:hypothetical protein